MEASDSALNAAPTPVRAILALVVNGVIPLVTSAIKAITSLERTIAALAAPRNTRGGSNIVEDIFRDSVPMETETGRPDADDTSAEGLLRGYFHASNPRRFANLFSAQENAAIVEQTNHVLRRHLVDKLSSELAKFKRRVEHEGIRELITDHMNETKVLHTFDEETQGTCTRVLVSKGVTSWIAQAARTQTVLDDHKAKTKALTNKAKNNNQKNPVKGPNKTVGKKKKPANQSGNSTKPNQVKPPINLIGKIHIPKRIYNLLKLGANYAIEWAQPTQGELRATEEGLTSQQQEEFSKYILTNKQKEFLNSHNITFDLYLEIDRLFTWMAGVLEIPEGQLWENFWHPDLKRAEVNLELFDYLKHPKNANPTSGITRLFKGREIIGKMADKNAGLTLMPHTWYHKKLMDHIESANAYTKISNDPSAKILAELNWICKKFGYKPEKWFNDKTTKCVVPQIYMMPKIHKTPIGVRPIIPSHTWYTTRAAIYIHRMLLPVVKKMNWVILDRLKLVQELENLSFNSQHLCITTMDVTAMYTSIDLGRGLDTVERICQKFAPEIENLGFIMRLLKWVLDNNYFQYKGTWYKQSKGAAMGGNASGVFADIVVAGMELTLLPNVPKDNKPLLYRRYRDDILLITRRLKDAKAVANHLNSAGMLEYNIEQFGDQVHFLDLTITKGARYKATNKLDIGLYIKPTKNPYFTHYSTYKPELTKTAWITGECVRILRASQTAQAYKKEINHFQKALCGSGFPRETVKSRMKYSFKDRNWLIEKQNPDDTLWYSMNNTKHAHESWNFIQNNFKPLLKFHNVTVTAHRGTTTLDVINKANKQTLLNPVLRQTNKLNQRLLEINRRNLITAGAIAQKVRKNYLIREYNRQQRAKGKQTAHQTRGPNSPPLSDVTEWRNAGPTTSGKPKRASNVSSEGASAITEPVRKKLKATNAVT
jgi:hypothetical protein